MASSPLFFLIQTPITSKSTPSYKSTTTLSLSLLFTAQFQQNHDCHACIAHKNKKAPLNSNPIISRLTPICSLSSNPPASKDEAILQAKTSLLTSLEKPLNSPKLTGKLKKLRQPRFRVEIPIIDDSSASLSQLALEIFGDLPIKRKGPQFKILIFWPNQDLTQAAVRAFNSRSSDVFVSNVTISEFLDEGIRIANSADVVVFFAPDASQLAIMKTVTDRIYPKPVVIFNPMWAFDEEINLDDLGSFVRSFDVVYSFMGLEVRGILSKKKGIIFRCVRNDDLSGEKWNVFVEEESQFRVVSSFKSRPSITEVENVLYNLMAMNSPVTKSAKFLKNLVTKVTGKK